jgi:hypothetical protein
MEQVSNVDDLSLKSVSVTQYQTIEQNDYPSAAIYLG